MILSECGGVDDTGQAAGKGQHVKAGGSPWFQLSTQIPTTSRARGQFALRRPGAHFSNRRVGLGNPAHLQDSIYPTPRVAYYRGIQYLYETLNFNRDDLIFMGKWIAQIEENRDFRHGISIKP